MSHAATGCLTETLTAEINQSSPQQACTYGAVVGELPADIYKESQGHYDLNANGEKVRGLLENELGGDFEYLTGEQLELLFIEQMAMLSDLKTINDTLADLRGKVEAIIDSPPSSGVDSGLFTVTNVVIN